MIALRTAVAVLLLQLVAAPAAAEERIIRFVSDVQVNADASLDVTETVDVVAENVRIDRGIFRDFPTRYNARRGGRTRVGFTFLGATRDGQPEPARTEPIGNGIRIRIGNPDVTIPPGEYRYVLRYRTTRQLGRFEDHDELYWNATGNGWVFPIEMAEARIRLPRDVTIGERAAYTGEQGATERDVEIVHEGPGTITWRTTRPLAAYEGLTVAAAFPKGVVAEANGSMRARWWLADHGPPIVGAVGLLALALFYLIAWKKAGRNPRPGTVVPIFAPPDELSPAAMRYVTKMGLDDRAFAAALVDMGVKGHIRMEEEDGGWLSKDKTRLYRLSGKTELYEEERDALKALIASNQSSVLMEQKNHAVFSAAKQALDKGFKARFDGTAFNRNWGWAIAGLLLWLAAIWLSAAAVLAATDGADLWPIGVALGAAATAGLLAILVQQSQAVGKCLFAGLAFIFGGVAVAMGMPVLAQAFATGWLLPMLIPGLAILLVVSGFFWMAAPTREGRAMLDRIAGFKQYLSITEGERLDRMNPPQDTPELFERYLPYAIALGVENRWADRFSDKLAAAAAQGQSGFGWYAGSNSPWNDTGRFADSVGSSLASSVSSASTAPGSSSGSGGGGSSGGGGGGGGGGGW
ncbi:MAG TPA: DUF2207 domain-containing protein [Sphingomicrobium sp.]